MPIRAVIFDIGGVILRTEDLEPRRAWERRLGLPERGLAKTVFDNPAAQRATLGQALLEDVWLEVARQLSLSPAEVAQLREDFWRGDAYDHDLLAFIGGLRPRLKTGVLSNAWPGARAYHQVSVGLDAIFDEAVFSAEEGVMKPNPEIYRRALARLGVAPDEAAFVDDMQENVEAARAVGMRGVRFMNAAQARSEVERLIEE
jgi:putative hydrolase of the HAD superfamily